MSCCENPPPPDCASDPGLCQRPHRCEQEEEYPQPPPSLPIHHHHRTVRLSHSIGADSAIEMHDDCLQNDGDDLSSSRSGSRTGDLEPHPDGGGPTFSRSGSRTGDLEPHPDGAGGPTFSRSGSRSGDLEPHSGGGGGTFSISAQSSLDESAQGSLPPERVEDPCEPIGSPASSHFLPCHPGAHGHGEHPQNGLETVNPILSRPPSAAFSQQGAHLLHARTYPTLTRPGSTCSSFHSAAVRCGRDPGGGHLVSGGGHLVPDGGQLVPGGGQLVPLPGHMYGMYYPNRSVPNSGGDNYSQHYTVQSPIDSLSSAGSLYGGPSAGGIFNADQPRDVRVVAGRATHFPFPSKPPLRKTDSSMTTNTDPSAYYREECQARGRRQSLDVIPLDVMTAETSPLSDKEKNLLFRHLITKTLSSVYAIFVIVLGAILYVNDVLGTVGHSYVEVFQVYLFMVAITFYIFIHIDIRRYVKTEHLTETLAANEAPCGQMEVHSFHRPLPYLGSTHHRAPGYSQHQTKDPAPPIRQQRPYGFNTGRHADSLYLKLGAVAFCFGSMIHDGLVFSKRLDIVVTQPFSSCMNVIDLFTPALNLVFSFYQLYFIFKHSNIIIHRYQEIARFGVMHSIAVNLCVWFRTLVDETIDEFSRKWSGEGFDSKDSSTSKVPAEAQFNKMMAEDAGWHGPASASSAGLRVADVNHTASALNLCSQETVLANIAQEAAPYLYPFTIEYTLIAAAVWYMIWSNIGGDESHNANSTRELEKARGSPSGPLSPGSLHEFGEASSKSSSYMIHVDCRSTNRGLFPGILVLVVTVISIIIFFVTISVEEYATTALIINNVSELSLYAITGVVTVFAFRKTSTLNLNHGAMKHTLDDFLLFVALPCFFIFSFFSIIAGIAASNPLSIIVNTASMVQVILQTTFIFDGLRRCSNNRELQRRKPGREMITFLAVCNVAMWTFSTFEIKRSETNPSQMLFYGEFEWSIISHLSVPLTIFYRFHSSVCLVNIWHSAYQPADAH
ncbi:hypothetical protein BV898_17561 [Hypsibius exemplaris]|uniref:Otopetrin-2 n=1 Tax=Hypsibius exemplaris TaxID=2072580 RepID=A0A9X6NHG6_HYPEX|nr:hypothetical protein BV898_17561 [Hypsibius exemplaris]